MIKRILVTAVAIILVCFTLTITASAENGSAIPVFLDGEELVLDNAPVRIGTSGDEFYLPLLAVCDAMGAKVTRWDINSQSALVVFREFAIDASAGDYYITANGRCLYTESKCYAEGNELMVPSSAIEKALDATICLSDTQTAVCIYSGTGMIMPGDLFYNEDDVYWLAHIINAEAGCEPFIGKVAVGNVVMNRVESRGFPNNIYDVIFDGIQFEPVLNGTVYNTPSSDSYIAAKLALEGADPVENCLFFASISDCWAAANRPYYGTIGRHHFWE